MTQILSGMQLGKVSGFVSYTGRDAREKRIRILETRPDKTLDPDRRQNIKSNRDVNQAMEAKEHRQVFRQAAGHGAGDVDAESVAGLEAALQRYGKDHAGK